MRALPNHFVLGSGRSTGCHLKIYLRNRARQVPGASEVSPHLAVVYTNPEALRVSLLSACSTFQYSPGRQVLKHTYRKMP